jgi:mRNA-degrading endonuclease YafQ of YafQ-DinJ toxin-antitoxin module
LFLVDRDDTFIKKSRKFFKKHPDLIEVFKSVILQLEDDYQSPNLRLHKLKGKLKAFHAVSLTYQYRVVIILKIEDKKIILVDIGTHDEVYG